jgi:hypothetical protein
MTLRDAETICAGQAAEDAWEYMRAHSQSFIWSDDEDPVSTWNRLFGASLGNVAVKPIPNREGFIQLSFRDRIIDVQLKFNREDRFRELHGLARVARPESDLRLCRDSTHSSDVAFFAMTLAEWNGLESKFGADKVAARFLPMDSPFDEFLEAAFAAPDVPRGALAPDLTDWEGGSSYRPDRLEYTLVWDGPGRPRLEVLRTIVRRYLEVGTVTVSFWRTPSRLSIDRGVLVETVADRIGKLQIRVSNLSRTGFVVVEPSGVAAGWRTDGWLPPDEAPTKQWLFWKRRDKRS